MISILCPTRGRPGIFQRMIDSVAKTSRPLVEIITYIDDDDRSYDAMREPRNDLPIRVVWNIGPRMTMSDMWNHIIQFATGDIFMLSGDDCIFRTPGWDEQVENAFARSEDKILLVYGDDGGPAGKVFATHPFIHRRWYEVIGYFTGPGFSCDYADTWPQDVAEMIGRKQYRDFKVEHMHCVWGKAEYDLTYRESNARLHRDNTPQLYKDRLSERQADAEKLRKVLNTPWLETRTRAVEGKGQ